MYIPLINESLVYAKKIDLAVTALQLSRHGHRKLVNLLHKFDSEFYEKEKALFLENPSSYIGSEARAGEISENFLERRVARGVLLKLALKILAHYLFRFIGYCQFLSIDRKSISIIRKCYVDDVEGLFDLETDVTRFIYPFPLNPIRQYRYLVYLKKRKEKFILTGVEYSLGDYLRLIRSRSYSDYLRLESRGYLAHAMGKKKFRNLKLVQCAEEYEIGSMTYCRQLKRQDVKIHNCAHGAGKYLPYHCYSTFDVITEPQREYYETFNRAEHKIRILKMNSQKIVTFDNKPVINFLGQYSKRAPQILLREESSILAIIEKIASIYPGAVFCYKAHPNCQKALFRDSRKIIPLANVLIGGEPRDILQLSLYSTCQIDPNFIGKKILVETELIKPAIIYGDSETIVKIEYLNDYLVSWLNNKDAE